MVQGTQLLAGLVDLLPEGVWLRAMRRLTRRDLLLFYAPMAGTYVVGEWVRKPRRWGFDLATCIELFTLPGHPDRKPFGLPSRDEMLEICRPGLDRLQEVQQQRRESRYEEDVQQAMNAEARTSAAKLARKEGADKLAFGIESGLIPVSGERDDDHREMVEDLTRAARSI